jgi:hypothetical protein
LVCPFEHDSIIAGYVRLAFAAVYEQCFLWQSRVGFDFYACWKACSAHSNQPRLADGVAYLFSRVAVRVEIGIEVCRRAFVYIVCQGLYHYRRASAEHRVRLERDFLDLSIYRRVNRRRDEGIRISDNLSNLDGIALADDRLARGTDVLAQHHSDLFHDWAGLYQGLFGEVFALRGVYAAGK